MKKKQHKETASWNINRHEVTIGVEEQKQNSKHYFNTYKGDTTMRQNTMFTRLGAAVVIALLISSVQQVFAAGTLAGTVITNQASVQYNAGSNVRTGQSNSATMTVGYKVSINLSANSSSTTSVDNTTIYKSFYFFNSGNYSDDFKITYANVPTGWTAQLYKDQGTIGVFDSDSAFASGAALYTDTTFANRIPLILAITIPRGSQAPDDTTANITVDIESNGSSLGSIVRVGGVGTETYTAQVTIAKPVLSYTIAHTAGANYIPGDNQEYTLTVTNSGHAATSGNSTVRLLYDDINLENETATSGSASNGIATWTISSLASLGGAATLTFKADIEQTSNNGTGVPYNTSITTGSVGSRLLYNDGINNDSVNISASTSFNVQRASGAYVSALTSNQSGNPGDSVVYAIRIKNRGNSAMTFTLSQALNGSSDLDTTHLFTDSIGVAGSQPYPTVSIAAGDSIDTLYVYLHVNVTGADGQTIIRNITATPDVAGATPNGVSNNNPTITITTTVTSPSLSILLTQTFIGGVGDTVNVAPGDTIEYTLTITNSGSGSATQLTSSNAIPTNTTFVADAYGSGQGVKVDGVAKTNAVDTEAGGNASCNGTTVSAGPFTVASSGTKTIKYRVVVN